MSVDVCMCVHNFEPMDKSPSVEVVKRSHTLTRAMTFAFFLAISVFRADPCADLYYHCSHCLWIADIGKKCPRGI